MILRTHYEGDREPRVLSEDPKEEAVAKAVESMDWSRFSFVTLYKDEMNWLDGSGCIEPNFGLSMMLALDGIEYVTERPPVSPSDMLPFFKAYLDLDEEQLFALIYDATNRNASTVEVEAFRRAEALQQRVRHMKIAVSEATTLFAQKEFQEYIRIIEPFESLLSPLDSKKLSLARNKVLETKK